MNRPKSKTLMGTQYIGKWRSDIPVYDIVDFNGLNQIIGYVKHINNDGMVLYRGQSHIYDTLMPNIQRNKDTCTIDEEILKEVIEKLYVDKPFNKIMSWNEQVKGWKLYISISCEALLQHYGAKTHCIDFVDNHWTALWFALHNYDAERKCFVERDGINDGDECISFDPYFAYNPKKPHSKQQNIIYQEMIIKRQQEELEYANRSNGRHAFLFLYFADISSPDIYGLNIGKNSYIVDLRKALPGIFLRPVSQHGWIVKGKDSSFDYNKKIICVLRLQTDLIKEFLGNGTLLSQEHFFPSPEYDVGYQFLLSRQLGNKYERSKYPHIFPMDMIPTME